MYDTSLFTIRNDGFRSSRGSEIEEQSMPKRLQDKIGFQEAKKHEQLYNIGPRWHPKSSQGASKIEVKNHSILDHEKQCPSEMAKGFLDPIGGNPPGHLPKAK